MVTPVKLLPVVVAGRAAGRDAGVVHRVPAKLVELVAGGTVAVVGMWPVPCGFGVTPVNDVPVALAAWQVVQPVVMPRVVHHPRLERCSVLVWHSVHAGVVGMWLAGLPLVTPVANDVVERVAGRAVAGGRVIRVLGRRRPGHDRHPDEALAGLVAGRAAGRRSPAWFICVPAKLVNLPAAWQVSQAAVVGRWFAGLVLRLVTPVKLLPVSWQVAQPA